MPIENLEPGSITLARSFQRLGRILTRGEWESLEAEIALKGPQRPLVIWAQTGILLDGYKTIGFCQRYRRRYEVKELSFPSKRLALAWRRRNVEKTKAEGRARRRGRRG